MVARIVTVFTLVFALVAGGSTAARADVDDFEFESWDSTYEITLDSRGRVIADVTEDIVAVFPDHDQNRGIVRSLMTESFGAPIGPRGISVADGTGSPVPFEVEDEDEQRYILVGDDRYVHGKQNYVISYQLNDVVAPMDDAETGGSGVDEFYWDLIPVDRLQTVDRFTATLRVSDDLLEHFNGNAVCLQGQYGSSSECDIRSDASGEFTIGPVSLDRREGVTVAIGFEPNMVVQPPARVPNWATDVFPYIPAGLAVLLTGLTWLFLRRQRRRAEQGRGVIVAQYDVPATLPPVLTSEILHTRHDPIPAQFVHLAVRGAVQIADAGKRPVFTLLDASRAGDALDSETLDRMFTRAGTSSESGRQFTVPKSSTSFAQSMKALRSHAREAADNRGFFMREKNSAARVASLIALGSALVASVFALAGVAVSRDAASVPAAIAVAALVLAGLMTIWAFRRHRVHSATGADAREYLLGVQEFISVAEEDRLRMLQSYSGAERETEQDAVGREIDVIRVYEHLLPYAMLFGLEREWMRILQVKYQELNTVPLWYAGMTHATMMNLDKSIQHMQRTVQSAASYTTSSSGGSSGGGFAGGGGGGGSVGGR